MAEQERSKRVLAVVTVVALALGMLGLSFQFPAQALTGSTFDATDGNASVEGAELDWASPAPNLQTQPDGSGDGDSSLSAEEDDTTPKYTEDNIQPNKSDLTQIRVSTEKKAAQDFLYLAWDRVPDPSGNVSIDFELNKNAQPALPSVGQDWALNRVAGDLLLTFELLNGGTAPVISLREWKTSGACESNPSAPCWGPGTILSTATTPAAEGSVNAGNDITFGEMAIDLGLAKIFEPGECTSFASVYAKSRSAGSGFNSQISDLVSPITKSISNCGSLTVTKTVTGPTVAGDQTAFGFTVDCGSVDLNGGAAGTDATFNLSHGGSQVVPDIPVGTSCSVTEAQPTPNDAWATSYKVNGGSATNGLTASNVVVPLAGATVAFTNARQVGSLTISKTTSGGTGTFTFNVDCSVDSFDQQVQITNSNSSTISNIPIGTTCTVTEVANGDFNSSPVAGYSNVRISGAESVSFTNTRKVGTLRIEKTTSGGSGTFLFAVDCTVDSFDRLGANKISITDSGSATITGIPTGTVCTVTEDPHADFTSTRSPTNGQVTIGEGTVSTNTVSFTNVRKVAGLTITKATSGGTGTFTFEVDCDGTAFDDTVTITGSGSVTIDGIPTGTDCNVTEVADPLFTSTSDPADGDVTIDDDGETVAFTNVRKTGSLVITKTATGGNGNFTFAVDCTDNAFDQTVVITTTGGAGSSSTISGIPTTTSCTVTETVPPGWAAVGGASKTVVVDGAETLAFTNRLLPSAIQVVKTASASLVQAGTPVTYTYVVTNLGENALTSVKVVDDKCATVTFVGGDTDGDSALDLTETWTYQCTSPLAITTTNVATATGVDPRSQTVQDTDTKTVTVINPAIAIDKAANATSVDPGTTVVYTYTVTNPGDVALSNVTVTDDKCSPVTFVGGDTNGDGLLQTTETWTFRCSQVQTGNVDLLTNIGTATGVDPLGKVVSSTDTVTVSVVAPLVLAQPPTLPRTGVTVRAWLQIGSSLLLLGVALVFTSRRIRRA
jgi:uncharacterized repeat protein (TIGR01451 family)